jgi:hypothetical protein
MSSAAQSLPVQEIIGNPNILNWAANTVTEADMPRTAVEEYWDLFLTGTLTLASYTTAPTDFIEAPETLIYSVQVNANAAVKGGVNEVFKNVDFPYLRFITHIYNGTDVTRSGIGTANAAYNFSSTPRLWFTDPLAKLPNGKSTAKSTMLDARLLSSLKLDIGWRDQTALVYGGVAGTATLSATQLQVLATHYYGVANVAPNGATITRNYLREVQQNYPVVSTSIDYQFQNLRVGAVLHRLTIKALLQPSGAPSTVSFADPSNVILNTNTTRAQGAQMSVKINNNAYIPLNTVALQLQNSDTKLFNLTNGWITGYYVYETSTSHNPRAMLNLRTAINMSLWADTEFTTGVQNNLQLTYVERVTPQ